MEFALEHLGLPARDPAVLKDWYIEILGGQLLYADGPPPSVFFVRLPGGIMLEIYQANASLKETSDNKVAGFRHLALRVGSLEAAAVELKQRGVKFTEDAKLAAGGGRVLFFADAEGNLLHLVERPGDSVFH
jgi:catechol 2,3-dioxygenase-like lactoylglutathione lyase family enzyme